MKDLLIVAAVLVTWIVLNAWVLPWFGIRTCMSGACSPFPASRQAAGISSKETKPAVRPEKEEAPDQNQSETPGR